MPKWKSAGGGAGEYDMWDGKGTVEGRYISRKRDIGPNKSNIYVLEREKEGKIGVWGSTVIDGQFEEGADGNGIPIGSLVQIKFLGWMKNGKPAEEGQAGAYKNYEVLYDDSDTGSAQPQPEAGADKDRPATDDDLDELFPEATEEKS